MEAFLRQSKQTLSSIEKIKLIHIVMGNESCDLDSCISSLTYAYLLNLTECHTGECVVLPVLNTNRALLKLKTEVLYWINNVLNISGEELICKDDLDLMNLKKDTNRQIRITLVDHNYNEELERIGSLTEIIDHHQPQVSSITRPIDIKTEIDIKVGSCCTLVARRYVDYCEKNQLKIDEQIGLLLYGTIILDTICFSKHAQRYSELDVQIIDRLESALVEYPVSRDDIYSQLIEAKNDISTLAFKECLLKDMKLLQPFADLKVITSSISGQLVREKILGERHDHVLGDLAAMCNDYNYSLILVMGIVSRDVNAIERDMAIYSPHVNFLKKVSQTLIDYNGGQLDLRIVESKSNLIVFSQKNAQASRKVVLPVLERLFKDERFIADWNAGFLKQSTKSMVDKLAASDSIDVNAGTNGHLFNEGKFSSNGMLARSASGESSTIQSNKFAMDAKTPDSINYYESYFMDSYTGDFVGDLANNKLDDQQINEINWCDEQRIENALEFGFGSFGPESILFGANNGDSGSLKKPPILETILESNEKSGQKSVETCDANGTELNAKKVKKSIASSSESDDQSIVNNTNDDYDDLVSLSVAEPQLKEKLNTCFDKNKIRNGYEMSVEPQSILALDHRSLTDSNKNIDSESCNLENAHSMSFVDKFNDQSTVSALEEFRLQNENTVDNLENENLNSLIENTYFKDSVCEGGMSTEFLDIEHLVEQSEKNDDKMDAKSTGKMINTSDLSLMDASDLAIDRSANGNSSTSGNDTSTTIMNISTEHSDQSTNENDAKSSSTFQRQSTLTKSQRRRITPKYKFEEMPNTLDHSDLILSNDSEDLLKQLAKEQENQEDKFISISLGLNNDSMASRSMKQDQSPLGVKIDQTRTGTLPKKKIVADILESSHEESINNSSDGIQNVAETDCYSFANQTSSSKPQNDQLTNNINSLKDDLKKIALNEETNSENDNDLYDDQVFDDPVGNWQQSYSCPMGRVGEIKKIDMKVIEPYTRVLSHAGYYVNNSSDQNQPIGESNPPAIILFSSCYLPDRARKDYDYVMDNLFMYVLTTLHQLIANEYIMIYFHNAGCTANNSSNNMPTFQFLRRCYFLIDRKLRKNLKALYLVHPTLWLKSIVIMTKPFINQKFSKKLKFVNNLSELNQLVPIDLRIIPDPVKQTDEVMDRRKRKRFI